MDALVISRHAMVLFISLEVKSLPQEGFHVSPGVLVGKVVGMLTTSGVWLISMVSSGIATCGDASEEVATGLVESSTLVEGEAPRATDVGLFGVESLDASLEVSRIAHDRSSWTSAVMLMWLSALGRCSMARWDGEGGVNVMQGAGALGIWSPGVTWGSSTSKDEGLWAGLPSISMPWVSVPDSEVTNPHLVLQGTPPGPHTVRVCLLLVSGDTHMHFCMVPHQPWHYFDPC